MRLTMNSYSIRVVSICVGARVMISMVFCLYFGIDYIFKKGSRFYSFLSRMEVLSRHDIYGHTKNYTQMTYMVYGKKS